MSQRISPAKLQRLQLALSGVISAVHDARVRHRELGNLRPRRLGGFSQFLKDLLALPHDGDYSFFEVQLKRRLVKTQHRLFGRNHGNGAEYGLEQQLPQAYAEAFEAYRTSAQALLQSLSDVDIKKNHQPLKPVHAIPH